MSKGLRRPLVLANWKMNMAPNEVHPYLEKVLPEIEKDTKADVAIAAQDLYLADMVRQVADSRLMVAAENAHWTDEGAYTGETSPKALAMLGVSYVLIGHFERRKLFNETDERVNEKTKAALKNGLKPIVDLDEDLSAYANVKKESVVLKQLALALKGLSETDMKHVAIAYEPTWAIGSGEAASAEQAEKSAALIRQSLANLYSRDLADNTRILYGGSVTTTNASDFLSQEDIDGILVGKAALDPDQFLKLVDLAQATY
ncbi:triose-phosphate isomerase [Fructobacillus sp. M1-13]|uniref:Triosephosphate isomerase n=1 Tax=Fructobacillus papyriferae TaxID=2713171 RepID=A0ABS5QR56_9LACO|nr:triose-phosphate isomerase [Fructobacillus papyriferae]MBS9335606.1 triose-phosphate isomerase [Fructobacillus papyriferae]MCD2159305.1 triose-phosphate isomerase [Fructobacillus papyriferae]